MSRYFSSSGGGGGKPSLAIKDPARVATTTNIVLSGLLSIDGVQLAEDDRVLVKDQINGFENGIYLASSGAWKRSNDARLPGSLPSGALVAISEGVTSSDTIFLLATNEPITIDVTSLEFIAYVSALSLVAGSGMTRSGLTLDVNSANNSRIIVNQDDIDLAETGIIAGTYTKLTIDIYGRALSAMQATTDDITEGLTNRYYTDERVDDRVAALLVAGSNITLIYSDPLNTLTINGPSWQYREVPVGTIDGANNTFTLAFVPNPVESLMLFKNGLLQMQGAGEDYTILGNTITFEPDNIPQAEFKLVAFYQK